LALDSSLLIFKFSRCALATGSGKQKRRFEKRRANQMTARGQKPLLAMLNCGKFIIISCEPIIAKARGLSSPPRSYPISIHAMPISVFLPR
jgi:hypothetical protein